MLKITPLLDTLRLQKISDDEYFSKKYSNYISNSRLGLIDPRRDGSPEKFFGGFKPFYSPALDLGSGVHCMTLQSENFIICQDVDRPTAKLGALADRLYPYFLKEELTDEIICREAAAIDYYGGNLSTNMIKKVKTGCGEYWANRANFEGLYCGDEEVLYYDPKLREIVQNCVRALNSNKSVQELLHPTGFIESPVSECEQAILLDIEVETEDRTKFILKLKSKLDNYTIDNESNVITVNDVKTIGKIVSEFPNNISRFGYNREIAMYSWLLSLCAKKFYNIEKPIVKGNYLIVSTIPQYYTKVMPMTKQMFIEGWKDFTYLLELVAKEVATNHKDFVEWITTN